MNISGESLRENPGVYLLNWFVQWPAGGELDLLRLTSGPVSEMHA